MRLRALLSFVGLSHLCLLKASALGLIVGLAISGTEFIGEKVAVGFFGWLW